MSRLVEKQLAEAAKRGELDIPDRLKGKPIPGIDESRPDGWWAESLVRRERSRVRREEADEALAAARVKFWQADSDEALAELVASSNAMIAHLNLNVVDEDRLEPLDLADITRRWRELRR